MYPDFITMKLQGSQWRWLLTYPILATRKTPTFLGFKARL
jgi:hypothetical protein